MWRSPNHPAPEPAAPPAETGRRLAAFPRNRGEEELRVNLAEFNGHEYLSLRVWSRGSDGNWWPVRGKGVSVRLSEIGELAEVLHRLERTLEARTPRQAAGRGAHQPQATRRATAPAPPRPGPPDRDHQPHELPGLEPGGERFDEF